MDLLDDVQVPLSETGRSNTAAAARPELARSRRRKCLRRVGDELVGILEVVDRVGEAVSAQRSGVLTGAIAAADVRRERGSGQRRDDGAHLPTASDGIVPR